MSTNVDDGSLDSNLPGNYIDVKGSQDETRAIVPVMIKHITSCTEHRIRIAGRTAVTFKLVGIVRRIELDATTIMFTVEDDTDTVVAVMKLPEDEKNDIFTLSVGTYVRIFATLRTQDDRDNYVVIWRIQPLESLNELTTHFLQVLCLTSAAKRETVRQEPTSAAAGPSSE